MESRSDCGSTTTFECGEMSNIVVSSLIENIRKVLNKINRNLKLEERDSDLIDLVNHADTLAEEIQLAVNKDE